MGREAYLHLLSGSLLADLDPEIKLGGPNESVGTRGHVSWI